jgi:glycosyltransferase involved in cell wall biosynthesis
MRGPGRFARGRQPARNDGAHVLFVVNEDWFFLSHRLPLALAAREAGMRVTVAAQDTGAREEIVAHGLEFVPLPESCPRAGLLPESRLFFTLVRLYLRLRPDLIHHVTIRPVIYGSLAARLLPSAAVVNAVSGLGYVFSDGGAGRARLRRIVEGLYRTALGRPRTVTIFQNPDDRDLFVGRGLVAADRTVIIRGSGVDCSEFPFTLEPGWEPLVMLPARMLEDKGIHDFVRAARILNDRGIRASWVLTGDPHEGNPTSIPLEQLHAWSAEGIVEWWGRMPNMAEVLAAASIVVLPSRREGLPKVLLEAAAVGRAMVATDVPGCREVVRPGHTGILVPPDDPDALADAVERLLSDTPMRRTFGSAARRMAETEFSVDIVVNETMELYEEILGGDTAGAL